MPRQAEQEQDDITGSISKCESSDHQIEKCIICLQTLDEHSLSHIYSLGYSSSSKLFSLWCRMLKINEKNRIFSWNFNIEILPFCFECLTYMNELTELYDKLEEIQKEITKIKNATQIRILLAENSGEIGKNCTTTCEKNKRNKYFRNQAVKDFMPILRMENITASLGALSQRKNATKSTPSSGFTILTISGNAPKHLNVRTENSVAKETVPTKSEAIPIKTRSTKSNNQTVKVIAETIFKEESNSYSEPSSPSPAGFDDFPSCNNSSEDEASAADSNSVPKEMPSLRNDLIHTVKSRKRKTLSVINNRMIGTDDNLEFDPDYTVDDVQQDSDNESDSEQVEPRSRRRRITNEDTELFCDGVKYSINEYGLFLCGQCHYSCTHLELLQDHVKKSHLVEGGNANILANQAEHHAITNVQNKSHLKRKVLKPSTAKKDELTCDGVKYSTDSSGLLLCSLCHTVCTSIVSFRSHINKSHIGTDGIVTFSIEENNLELSNEGESPNISYKQYEYTTNEKDEQFECSTCKKSFNGREEVILHIQNVHIATDKLEANEFGEKHVYKNSEYLVNEKTGHCKCCRCKKKFRSRQSTILHIENDQCSPADGVMDVHSKYEGEEGEYQGFKFIKKNSVWKCSTCDKKLTSKDGLYGHITVVHAKGKLDLVFKAGERIKKLDSGNWVYENVEFSKDESTGQLVCSHCSRMYVTLAAIQSHIRESEYLRTGTKGPRENKIMKIGDNEWKIGNIKFWKSELTGKHCCGLCKGAYQSMGGITNHIRFHHLGNNKEDGINLLPLKSKLTLTGTPRKKFFDHIDTSERTSDGNWMYRNVKITKDQSTGKYSCSQCGTSYTHLQTIKKHIRFIHLASKDEYGRAVLTMTGKERKKWNAKMFVGDDKFCWRGIEYTLMKEEGSTLTKFHCLACDHQASIANHSSAHLHIRYRHMEKQFACSTCEKRFHTKRDVDRHELFHLREGTFQCDQCGVVTKTLGILTAHKKNVHDKVRHCVCHFCGKSFFRQKDCNNHMRTHTKEKPFQCDYPGCNSSFSIKISLNKHKLTHDRS